MKKKKWRQNKDSREMKAKRPTLYETLKEVLKLRRNYTRWKFGFTGGNEEYRKWLKCWKI